MSPHPSFESPGDTAEQADQGVKFVSSGTGWITWTVFERLVAHQPGAHSDRCLLFFADGIVRRVWSYPSSWHSLSADGLQQLMEGL
ncbi:MAG: hypothetical protein JWO05_267 [Gemmatimonadetes bacterium]|nr:hypothetical protein [Gemmatimonadota bacterium]